MSLHSIAETCFFVAPKSSSRKRKRGHFEDSRQAHAYQACLEETQAGIETILREENSALVKDVATFLEGPKTEAKLPCGIIVSGGDTSIDRLYTRVKETLNDRVDLFTMVSLLASDCSNLRVTMKKIVQTIVTSHRPIQNQSRVQPHDLRLVEAWITHQRAESTNRNVKIVLALQSIETFPSGLISDLVDALSAYNMDFRVLFSVSTALNNLQDILPARTVRKLQISHFEVDPNESTLDRIIFQQLIESPTTLRLGYDAYISLLNDYVNANRSVDLFISGIKYSRICHFFTLPLARFLYTQDLDLDERECDMIRSLQSFRQFIKKCEQSDDLEKLKMARSALTDDASLQALCRSFVDDITAYKRRLHTGLVLLFVVMDNVQSDLKTKGRSEVYKILLDRGLAGSSIVKELLLSIKVMRSESLKSIFEATIAATTDPDQESFFRAALHELAEVAAIDEVVSQSSTGRTMTFEERRLALGWKDKRSIEEAAQKLREKQLKSEHEIRRDLGTRGTNAARKTVAEATRTRLTEKERRFTDLVDRVHAQVAETFERCLVSHESLPLHELFWYDGGRVHAATHHPEIRAHLRAALTDHTTFLGGDGAEEPATAALFRLFQDSGQLINLYDWFEAFKEVSHPSIDRKKVRPEDDDDDEEEEEAEKRSQALFVQSVAELKFLGLFKSTKRKTDHVQKTISIL